MIMNDDDGDLADDLGVVVVRFNLHAVLTDGEVPDMVVLFDGDTNHRNCFLCFPAWFTVEFDVNKQIARGHEKSSTIGLSRKMPGHAS